MSQRPGRVKVGSSRLQPYVDAALAQGWRARQSSSNHLILLAPDGVTTEAVSVSKVAARAVANQIAGLKRKGVTLSISPSSPTQERTAMPQGKRTDQATLDKIVDLRRAGVPVDEVAAVTGVSEHTVSRLTPPELKRGYVAPTYSTMTGPAGAPGPILTVEPEPDHRQPPQEPRSDPEPASPAYPVTEKVALRESRYAALLATAVETDDTDVWAFIEAHTQKPIITDEAERRALEREAVALLRELRARS